MNASGGAIPEPRQTPQVELLATQMAQMKEVSIRLHRLASLCRMAVVGTGADQEKGDEDQPDPQGVLNVTTHNLKGIEETLLEVEVDLVAIQEELGGLAQ